ncbi:MAG: invasin domain 3-containing protein [Gemmatimonadales bacterium]
MTTCTDNTGPAFERPGEQVQRFVTPTGLQSLNAPEVAVAAGDIATCSSNNDEATAALVDNIPGTVLALGDNAYLHGAPSDYTSCYVPTWGRHKARTNPVPGNHDYDTPGGSGYFAYFGSAAGTSGQGYYSYDVGAWHIIALNSEISKTAKSAQMTWLKADLAAHSNLCTLAYWHEPLYSSVSGSGSGGSTNASARPLWDTLYAHGADVILNGHRHAYERIAPIKPNGTVDATFGIRSFVVGTGGIGHNSQTNVYPQSQVRNSTTFGVLKLYLYDDSYAWKFVPIAGQSFTDSSSTACHGPPSGAGTPSASQSTVAAAPGSIVASNGANTSTITVTARDANNTPVSGASVVLAATGSGNTLTQPSGPTNGSGVATGTLSSTGAGPKTVSATISGIAITQTATVTVTSNVAAQLAFTVQPTTTQTAASITPPVQVTVQDQFGNPVTGANNSVTVDIGTNPAGGTLTGTLTATAANGVASFADLKIDNVGTGYTLTAAAGGLTGATSSAFDITARAPSASQSTVSASPGSIVASSGANTSTITVTAKDAGGTPLSGQTVVLAATGSGNTLTQPTNPTDANGVATGTLSSTGAGDKTVSATISGVAITQTATVTVTAGLADAGQSTVAASPGTITTGTGSSTITVTVRDAFANPVGGSSVVLAATGTGNTLTQPSGLTNTSGVATGTLSSTNPETKTVSATADLTAITQTAAVIVTAQPPPGITHTLLTSGVDLTNATVYTTASIAPAANKLITIAVLGYRAAGAISPTIVGGGMGSWTLVTSVDFDTVLTPRRRLLVFRAMSASPGSGPITITFASQTSNAEWSVSQWGGVETSGANGANAIVQTGTNRADASGGLSVSLGAFADPNDVAFGVFGVKSQTASVTPGSGFTELSEQPAGEFAAGDLQTESAVNRSTINASWPATPGGALGIELKVGSGP